ALSKICQSFLARPWPEAGFTIKSKPEIIRRSYRKFKRIQAVPDPLTGRVNFPVKYELFHASDQ
ncbi:MAG: hypothetical protein MK103_07460, partial [Planctomycetes bacterium]|nr:hypothetical protein [Planctomycetota bacterium]